MRQRRDKPGRGRYHRPVTLRLLFAPSIGTARAQARAELLEQSLGGELGEPVAIEICESYAALEKVATESEAELVWAPPAVVSRVESLARAIYKCVRSGRSSYRSALVMRKGEALDFASTEGLRGIWVDRLSIGGHLLAIEWLKSEGADLEKLFSEQKFAGSYPDALREVIYEKADLTAVGVHLDDPDHIAEAIGRFAGRVQAERLTHVGITGETPTDALVLTDAFPADKADKLASRLIPDDPETRAPQGLCLALEVDGFERAKPGEYQGVRQLLAYGQTTPDAGAA